ncbi:E3 ubiquitin-protein ligase At4g11680 [Linum grandiflorum]
MDPQLDERHQNPSHVVHITEASNGLELIHGEIRMATAAEEQEPAQPCSSSASASNAAAHSSAFPSYYKVLVSMKLSYNAILIIASTIVLILARHERPSNPLFSWVVGYTIGCVASIPVTFRHCFLPHPRLCRVIDQIKLALELFYASWFMVGNYWVFTERSSNAAHRLYSHCIALVVLSYVKYVGPFILQALVVCCCRGFLNPIVGAPVETIDSLPIYKFKSINTSGSCGELDDGGGVVGAGTERERNLSGDDAACCICLATYGDDDELKELPCSHLFHASCVDVWLKLKAFCPLCKCRIDRAIANLPSATSPVQ